MENKGIPTISLLMRAMILGDYKEALVMVTDKDFNPNETTRSWNTPIISAIMTVLNGTKFNVDNNEFREVFKKIISNENFNPNIVDSENETVIMKVVRMKEFVWLAPLLLDVKGIDLTIKNYLGLTALDLATRCKNTIVADLIMAHNAKTPPKGSPKKISGIKKKKTVASIITGKAVLDKIEMAFTQEQKDNPLSLYNLVKFFLLGNYDECIRIVNHVHFNPNETDRWEEPVLSSLIYYSQDQDVTYDEEKFKVIVNAITHNRHFDVNSLDSDCNTPLMVAMGFTRLDWLVKELFRISSARIDIRNDMGEDLKDIAEKCGNSALYSDMIRRSYELVNSI